MCDPAVARLHAPCASVCSAMRGDTLLYATGSEIKVCDLRRLRDSGTSAHALGAGSARHGVLQGHSTPVVSCAWPATAAWGVSASRDGQLCLWDGSGELLLELGKPLENAFATDRVARCIATEGGECLMTLFRDGIVKRCFIEEGGEGRLRVRASHVPSSVCLCIDRSAPVSDFCRVGGYVATISNQTIVWDFEAACHVPDVTCEGEGALEMLQAWIQEYGLFHPAPWRLAAALRSLLPVKKRFCGPINSVAPMLDCSAISSRSVATACAKKVHDVCRPPPACGAAV